MRRVYITLIIQILCWIGPYCIAAKIYTLTAEGHESYFFKTLAVLLALRFFFLAMDEFGKMLNWRINRKEDDISYWINYYTNADFPKRIHRFKGAFNYFDNVENDPGCPQRLKAIIAELRGIRSYSRNSSFIECIRFEEAMDEALLRYSPTEEIPVPQRAGYFFGSSGFRI